MKVLSLTNQPPIVVPASGANPVRITPASGLWDSVIIPNFNNQQLFIRAQHVSLPAPTNSEFNVAVGSTFVIDPMTTLTLNFSEQISLFAVVASVSASVSILIGVTA